MKDFRIKEQLVAAAFILIVCFSLAGTDYLFWSRAEAKVKEKWEKVEQIGSLKTIWSVEAQPFELKSEMRLTFEKVSNYLTNQGYANLSNKQGSCSPDIWRFSKTFCLSGEFLFVVSGRTKLYPSIRLQFDRKQKLLKKILTADGKEVLSHAALEPPRIYELEPLRVMEKAQPKKTTPEIQSTDDSKDVEKTEVFKQSQPTYRYIKIGSDLKKDSLFIKLLLWLEDRNYFEHNGISYRGGLRAAKENLFGREGQPTQGSSTISSQVCKQLFSRSKSRSPFTKIEEFYCASALEKHLTKVLGSKEEAKNKILELYINLVPLLFEKPNQEKKNRIVEEIVGFGAASELHIGKKLRDLNLAESVALLSAVPAPNRIIKEMSSTERRDDILKEFADAHPEHAELTNNFIGQQVKFKFLADGDLKTDDVLNKYTKDDLRSRNIFSEINEHKNVTVITSIDWQMQAVLARPIENELKNFKAAIQKAVGDKVEFDTQVDFLAMNSTNGDILNLLSLKTIKNATFPNLQSIDDPFKPGSSIKPLFTGLMIDNKLWTMDRVIIPSECRALDGWRPDTAAKYTTGETVRSLLLVSNNPFMNCACRDFTPQKGLESLNQLFGRDEKMLKRLDNERKAANNEHPCRMFWGVSSDTIVTIFNLAAAYTVFPTGVRQEPVLYKQIYVDGEPQKLSLPQPVTLMSKEAATIVAQTMKPFAINKLGNSFKGELMAKTGSTTFSYIFIVASAKTVFLTHFKIVPKSKNFPNDDLEDVIAGKVAVPLMKEALIQINKERPQWLEGSFENTNLVRLRVKNGCVTTGESGEIETYLPGTEPQSCSDETEVHSELSR